MVIVALHTYAILITSQASYFLSSCFYLESFCEDFDQSMLQLNELIEENGVRLTRLLRERLSHSVQFNIQITE